MIAVCKISTKRLIKGHRYEIESMWNAGVSRYSYLNGKLMIKGIGRFSVNTFTDVNGDELPKVDITNTQPIPISFKFEDCSKNDILVCKSDRYKTFVKDGMYKVEELTTDDVVSYLSDGSTYTRKLNYVKFFGIKRKLKFNPWSFRKLNPSESREISLNHILNNEDTKVIVSTVKRNIELVEDKDDVLLKTLAKSILDVSRHHLSIVDWACEKQGDKLSLQSSDFEPYLNMTLSEILEKIK
jgi:hypothetical protein